jgi:hypothetical protein
MLQKLKLITCAGLLGLPMYSIAQVQTNIRNAITDHPDWVQIPGQLIRPDCVHEIPNGAKVEIANGTITGDVTLNGTFIAHYDACSEAPIITRPRGQTGDLSYPPSTGNGWVEAAEWEAPLAASDNIDYMGGYWTVPPHPSANGALIYLFNGIEPSTQNWILQPVLQYGSNGLLGGNYWAIASWFVGPGYAFHSALFPVCPGNFISGVTKMSGATGSTQEWTVQAYDYNTYSNAMIMVGTSGLHWNWAYAAVLEVYGLTSCSQFPAGGQAIFTNSSVYHGFPSTQILSPGWFRAFYSYGGPSCNFYVFAGTSSILYF